LGVAPQPVTLISGFDWTNPDRRREFLRAVHLPDGRLGLFRQQGSAVLTSAVVGHGLIDNPPGPTIPPGAAAGAASGAGAVAGASAEAEAVAAVSMRANTCSAATVSPF